MASVNPYVPGQPTSPDTFAGRPNLLTAFSQAIAAAQTHRRSSAFLLYGYRGSGKTSAIRKFSSLARESAPASIRVEIPLREHAVSEEKLLAALLSEVKREAEANPTTSDRVREFFARFRGVTVGPAGFVLDTPTGPAPANALTTWRECMASLDDVPFLLLTVDDAEQLGDDGLGTLKTIAESQSRIPIILAVAGSLDLSDRLSERAASPVGRVFSGNRYDIGEFSPAETSDALESPPRALGSMTSWSNGAKGAVHRYAHGYPYLVQCLAYATFREGVQLDEPDVERSLEASLEVAAPWLDNECAEASNNDILAFYKIAATGRLSFSSTEITSMGILTPYIGRLVVQKILKKIARGRYELRKAPAIAYYHLLHRGLADRLS